MNTYFYKYLIFFILICFFTSCKNVENNSLIEKNLEVHKKMIEFILKKDIEQYKLEGLCLSDTIEFSNGGSKMNLSSIIKSKEELLFFVFTSASCSSCIDIAITQLKELFMNGKSNKTTICIISDHNLRELKIFKSNYKIKNEKFIVLKGNKDFLNLFKDYPTFFKLQNNRLMKVYIHDKSYEKTTYEYLRILE